MSDYKQTRDAAGKVTKQYDKMLRNLGDDDLVKDWDEYVESMGSVMGEVEHMAQQMRDRIEELEAKLKELLVVSKRAVRLSLDHADFKLYAMEPMHQAIAAAELKGEKDE